MVLSPYPVLAGPGKGGKDADRDLLSHARVMPPNEPTSFLGLQPRMELHWRFSEARALLATQMWLPLVQSYPALLYADARFMGDDQDTREGNIGLGYRHHVPELGGIIGGYIFFDRRITEHDTVFKQLTVGVEKLGDWWDLRFNRYQPLSDTKRHGAIAGASGVPFLAGTGIFIGAGGQLIEEPLAGFDWEVGMRLPILENTFEAVRVYMGRYHFDGDDVADVNGWRGRLTLDLTDWVQIGGRFQKDDARGWQSIFEATLRFPAKASRIRHGVLARFDESAQRDIDIVTQTAQSESTAAPVTSAATGAPQKVYYVDNTAPAGGDGSLERPFNALSQAQTASAAHDVIYIYEGNGTAQNQNTGITLKTGQMMIGSAVDFAYSDGRFQAPGSGSYSGFVLKRGGGAGPVITNTGGDGIVIQAGTAEVDVAGLRVRDTAGSGLSIGGSAVNISRVNVTNAGAHGFLLTNAHNVSLDRVSADGSMLNGVSFLADDGSAAHTLTVARADIRNSGAHGIYVHTANNASQQFAMHDTDITANTWHGVALYDDSAAGSIAADLGGGAQGSAGRNGLFGNGREDLAIELDGGSVAARGNWWGQASGPDTDSPATGIDPQIYFGAPLFYDDLYAHWTFDAQWMNNVTAYDRWGTSHLAMGGGLTAAGGVAGQIGGGLQRDGVNDTLTTANGIALWDDVTIAFWHNTPAGAGALDAWFTTRTAGSNSNTVMYSGGGRYQIYLDNNATAEINYISNGATVFNTWQHVTHTYDAADLSRLYINGAADTVGPNRGTLNFGATLELGNDACCAGRFMATTFDDFRIYSRDLTAAETAELHRMNGSSLVDFNGFLASAPAR